MQGSFPQKRYQTAVACGPQAVQTIRKINMNSAKPALDPSELLKWLTALRRAVNTPN